MSALRQGLSSCAPAGCARAAPDSARIAIVVLAKVMKSAPAGEMTIYPIASQNHARRRGCGAVIAGCAFQSHGVPAFAGRTELRRIRSTAGEKVAHDLVGRPRRNERIVVALPRDRN